MDIKVLENEINELAKSYYSEKQKGNSDRAGDLRLLLWTKCYDWFLLKCSRKIFNKVLEDSLLIDKDEAEMKYDEIMFRMPNCIKNFVPGDKGNFCAYMSKTFSIAIKHLIPNNNINFISIDEFTDKDDEDSPSIEETIPDKKSSRCFDDYDKLNALLADLVFILKKAEEKISDIKKMWYSIFFTEHITDFAKNEADIPTIENEKNIFSSMELPYLDYYMTKRCRHIRQIAKTPLKKYGELVLGKALDQEVNIPLPDDVSLSYVKKAYNEERSYIPSTRSNFFKFYCDYLKNELDKKS